MFSIVVISGVCVIVLSTLDAANSERGERASANVEDDDKGEDRKKSWDLDGLWRRLEAAVERGELTAEEARERYAAALEKADVEEDDDVKLREFRKAVVQRAMALPPEEWSDELKRAILRAGWDLAEFTEGVRLRQQKSQDGDAQRGERASANVEDDDKGEDRKKSWDLDGLWRRLEAAVERGELTAEEARERYAAALEKADVEEDDDVKLREFRKAVVQRAMALPPEEWSDELKRAILRAGWDLAEFTEGVRLRQQKSQDGDAQRGERASANVEDDSPNAISGESIAEPETAVKQSSWGQVKRKSVRTE